MPPFCDRANLLKMFDHTFEWQERRLTILYGVEGVGQTALVRHWLKTRRHPALYFAPPPASGEEHLRAFSQAFWSFTHGDTPPPADFSFRDWEAALLGIDRLATQADGLIVVLDNFASLLAADFALPYHLKVLWDHCLQHGRVYLILLGGQPSPAYVDRMLSYSHGELYGRATTLGRVNPLPFEAASRLVPRFSVADRITLYACLGGMPGIWQQVDPHQSVEANLKRLVLSADFGRAVQARVQNSAEAPKVAEAILRVMAAGVTPEKDIARAARVSLRQARRCLYQLEWAGLVELLEPAIPIHISQVRISPWRIRDHQVNCYYRFLVQAGKPRTSEQSQAAWPLIWRVLPDFVRQQAFRELCESWLYRTTDHERLPSAVMHFGGHWPEGQPAIKLMGRSDDFQTVLLAEYFWTERPVGAGPIRAFVQRAKKSLPTELQGAQLQCVFFSKAGFTPMARQTLPQRSCQWIGLPDLEKILRCPVSRRPNSKLG